MRELEVREWGMGNGEWEEGRGKREEGKGKREDVNYTFPLFHNYTIPYGR